MSTGRRGTGHATPHPARHRRHPEPVRVSIPSAEAGGVRPRARRAHSERGGQPRFNPLRRSGGRATPSAAGSPLRGCSVRFNPLRRSGGRATRRLSRHSDRNPPLHVSIPSAEAGGVRRAHRRTLCRLRVGRAVSIPSAEAGGVRLSAVGLAHGSPFWELFQSPPPKRGACDMLLLNVSLRRGAAKRFNPLRRSGGRATRAYAKGQEDCD